MFYVKRNWRRKKGILENLTLSLWSSAKPMPNVNSIVWDYMAGSSCPVLKPGRGTYCWSPHQKIHSWVKAALIDTQKFFYRSEHSCAGSTVQETAVYTGCLQGNQSLSVYPIPCVTRPGAPSLRSGLEILCIPWIASLLELLGGTELTKLKYEIMRLYVFMKGGKGGREKQNEESADNVVALLWALLKAIDFLS